MTGGSIFQVQKLLYAGGIYMYILQPEANFFTRNAQKSICRLGPHEELIVLPRAPSWIKGASRQERTTKGQGRNKGWTDKRDRLGPFHKFLDPPVV